jgi:mRNA interferase RelE/StbE
MSRKSHFLHIKGKKSLYKIFLKKSAELDLNRINEPDFSRILTSVESLEKNPRNLQVKKLIKRKNEYRLRVGNYRVLFIINEKEKIIRIARVLHRKDAYKQ